MKYTYKISEHANSEIFSGLKSDIGYLYPEFVFEKEIKDADGSRTDFFRCEETGENIAAELSYANNNIVLTADIAMPELAEKYKIDKSEARENDRGISFDFKGIIRALFCTPLGIKLFAVPLALIVLVFIYEMFWGGFGLYGVVSLTAIGIYGNVLYCGGLFAIPTALVAWRLAVKKNDLSYKAPLFIFMIFSELHLLIFYYYVLNDIRADDLYDLFFAVKYFIYMVPYLLAVLYLYLLPVIIADEVVSRKHKKIYGKRAKGWQSAIWWSGTVVAMYAVLIAFGAVSSYIEISKVQDIAVEESVSTYEVIDPLLEKHQKAMRTVSDYAAEHNYYDWYCCPDESVKDEWQELFVDESEYIFHYKLDNYDSPSFSVYINGEGRGRYDIRFEGEDIYVNDELFNEEEVGFSV